jgi:hypothetical protein
MAHVLFTLFVMFAYSARGIKNILCCIIVLFVFDYPNVASFYILSIQVPLTISLGASKPKGLKKIDKIS